MGWWVAIVVNLAVGAFAYLHADGFMATFNGAPAPELAARVLEPMPMVAAAGSAGGAGRGRATIVVVDGLRHDRVGDLGLGREPAVKCELQTVLPSFSRPAYVALSTGVGPLLSGARTNDHEGPAGLVSLWEVARAAGLSTALVADGTDWWVELFPGAFGVVDLSGRLVGGPELPVLEADLTLVHLVHADDEAHDHGTGERYRVALGLAGRHIERLLSRLGPRDSLWLTSDHGHIERGGHGGPEPEVMAVPLWVFGAGPFDAKTACRGELVDVAVSVAAKLGLPPPPASVGRPLPGLVVSAELGARLEAQASALAPVLERASARGVGGWGLALAGLAWFILVMAARSLVWGRRARGVWVAVMAMPALGVLAWWAFEPTLSMSAVWLEGPWVMRMSAVFGGAALVACWLGHQRLATSEALVAHTLGAALPFILAVAGHGALTAGPQIGDPRAAFAVVLTGLFATVGCGVALLASGVMAWRARGDGALRVWA